MKDRLIAWGLGLAALALYGMTAAPTVATVFDDSLEFQVVLPTLGIAHPTGYPLYTLLGWLCTRLWPFGDAAYRANPFSALAAALTVALLYRLLVRVTGARIPALLATVLFAISPLWWSQATLAEVYALHGLFVVALWLVAFDEGPRSRLAGSSRGSTYGPACAQRPGVDASPHDPVAGAWPGAVDWPALVG